MFGSDGDFSIAEFGMALGLGEEIGLGVQEDIIADIANKPEPLSLEDNKQFRRSKPSFKRNYRVACDRMFERWVHKIITGEIDPYDPDLTNSPEAFEDPI